MSLARRCSGGALCSYTKPRGQIPDYDAPVVLPRKNSTVKMFCQRIHKSLLEQFKYALVWGSSVKHKPQKVGLDHVLEDEDVVQVIKKVQGFSWVHSPFSNDSPLSRLQRLLGVNRRVTPAGVVPAAAPTQSIPLRGVLGLPFLGLPVLCLPVLSLPVLGLPGSLEDVQALPCTAAVRSAVIRSWFVLLSPGRGVCLSAGPVGPPAARRQARRASALWAFIITFAIPCTRTATVGSKLFYCFRSTYDDESPAIIPKPTRPRIPIYKIYNKQSNRLVHSLASTTTNVPNGTFAQPMRNPISAGQPATNLINYPPQRSSPLAFGASWPSSSHLPYLAQEQPQLAASSSTAFAQPMMMSRPGPEIIPSQSVESHEPMITGVENLHDAVQQSHPADDKPGQELTLVYEQAQPRNCANVDESGGIEGQQGHRRHYETVSVVLFPKEPQEIRQLLQAVQQCLRGHTILDFTLVPEQLSDVIGACAFGVVKELKFNFVLSSAGSKPMTRSRNLSWIRANITTVRIAGKGVTDCLLASIFTARFERLATLQIQDCPSLYGGTLAACLQNTELLRHLSITGCRRLLSEPIDGVSRQARLLKLEHLQVDLTATELVAASPGRSLSIDTRSECKVTFCVNMSGHEMTECSTLLTTCLLNLTPQAKPELRHGGQRPGRAIQGYPVLELVLAFGTFPAQHEILIHLHNQRRQSPEFLTTNFELHFYQRLSVVNDGVSVRSDSSLLSLNHQIRCILFLAREIDRLNLTFERMHVNKSSKPFAWIEAEKMSIQFLAPCNPVVQNGTDEQSNKNVWIILLTKLFGWKDEKVLERLPLM
eukprot:g41239.t1